MTRQIKKTSSNNIQFDKNYRQLINEIKSRLYQAQLRAAISVNHGLIRFYWDVGNLIIERQKESEWGDKLFDSLAFDLSTSFSGIKGFSKTNLKNMRIFATHYPNNEFGQALPAQLTWTHHVVLIRMIQAENFHEKLWYSTKVIENGWSYRELKEQIQSNLYERQADKTLKTTNFYDKLPSPSSHLAQEMLKDPYKFHFLTIGDDARERELHNGLINHIKQFLMELGQGFSLYGTKYPILVSNNRFEIDLLMYHTKLHCYVVIELKRGDFYPHHTGQLNFYLSAVDEQLKTPEDGPTIGILLCEKKDHIIAEYALRNIASPMGIAQYELSKSLPDRLNNVLPTTDEIEAELNEFSKTPMLDK